MTDYIANPLITAIDLRGRKYLVAPADWRSSKKQLSIYTKSGHKYEDLPFYHRKGKPIHLKRCNIKKIRFW